MSLLLLPPVLSPAMPPWSLASGTVKAHPTIAASIAPPLVFYQVPLFFFGVADKVALKFLILVLVVATGLEQMTSLITLL